MERWVVAAKRADFTAIGKEFGIDPVIARLIRNRDVQDREEIRRYLYGTVEELASPHLMKDVDKAVEILRNKIKEKKRIRIIGDYDIDGVCDEHDNNLNLMMSPEKKEGWVNLCKNNYGDTLAVGVFPNREEAVSNCPPSYLGTIKIEWEE